MSASRIVVLSLLCLLTGACSGGGGGSPPTSPPPPPPPPPPPADQSMGGFWAGVLTFDEAQGSELFVGLVTEDGLFHLISAESSIRFIGMQSVDSSQVTGAGRGYAAPGNWPDGTTVTGATTDGQLVERDSFSGNWSTDSGETGSFEFFYDEEYERPSSLSLLEGVWTAYDEFGGPMATFTIDALGDFTGQNSSGCTSSGQFLVLDDRYNVYGVSSTISNCFIAGDYDGVAALGDDVIPNDSLVLSIGNDMRSIVLGLEK